MLRCMLATALFLPAITLAQPQQPNPTVPNIAMENALKQLQENGGRSMNSQVFIRGTPPPQASGVCSVRLQEMQIAKDKNFTMRSFRPPATASVLMPEAKLPAPPCP